MVTLKYFECVYVAMSLQQIRINKHTVSDLKKRGERIGNPPLDTIIRVSLAELDLLKSEKSENECLKKRNADLEREKELLKKKLEEFEKTEE